MTGRKRRLASGLMLVGATLVGPAIGAPTAPAMPAAGALAAQTAQAAEHMRQAGAAAAAPWVGTRASSTAGASGSFLGPGQEKVGGLRLSAGEGTMRMKELLQALSQGEALQGADAAALSSARKATAGILSNEPQTAAAQAFAAKQSHNWLTQAREAFVQALPPKDRELGKSIILGDGTIPGGDGQVYIFVSRSMPMALLRAYAADALYSGAILVTKGIRRGETVKDYVQSMLDDYNSADGQVLATQEINPNLFDMFDVKVVPTVVWTNRAGLEDVGSGCEAPAPLARPRVTLDGPNNTKLQVEKPTCLPAPDSSYYKLAGALKMDYVLERFVKAGAPASVLSKYRERMRGQAQSVFQARGLPASGNAIQPLSEALHVDVLPTRLLEYWQEELKHSKVRRGPYGPAFGDDGEDDPAYREELEKRIRHGLGLS